MSSRLKEIFEDITLCKKIRKKLPYLFQIAEVESSKKRQVGMEVGSLRERIIVAMLIYKFGEEVVNTGIGKTESGVDVILSGEPVSIKTISCKKLRGFKLVWTVDQTIAKNFFYKYLPKIDLLLVHINWGAKGGLYYFPSEAQKRVFINIGRESYLKLPKEGTNPRGVEITKQAVEELIKDTESKFLEIYWERDDININPYERWIEYWMED